MAIRRGWLVEKSMNTDYQKHFFSINNFLKTAT